MQCRKLLKLSEFDVTVVATRRSELLKQTLHTFSKNLFSKIHIRRMFCNIDPLWGDERGDREIEETCRSYFADVVIRKPEKPSFGAAVKWLWSQPQTDWFLHLEDDWLLTRPIDVERLSQEMSFSTVEQISFTRLNRKAWRKGVWVDRFTTSPSLVRSSFARLVSSLMDPELDPEKQMYGTENPILSDVTRGEFRHRLHGHRFSRDFLEDIGRAWREERGIVKKRVGDKSIWIEAESDDNA